MLLSRPNYDHNLDEIVNDIDCFVSNVWRSLKFSPDKVAEACDYPVNHVDLTARRLFLIKKEGYLREGLISDPKWHDPELAGYWIWAASCWIGGGVTRINAIPRLTNNQGVHKLSKRPHVAQNAGVHKLGQIPNIHKDRGVHKKSIITVGDNAFNENIYTWFKRLQERLRYVKVVCGDWKQVCGGNWQDGIGEVGIFFDPPYSDKAKRADGIYHQDSLDVAHEVREWSISRAKKKDYKIVIAGYYDEHAEELLKEGWTLKRWKANGGYSNIGKGNDNRKNECLFFSPGCIKRQGELL